ncbi:MAG: acyl-CoA desaturase [Coleofasciculaceae cyanobacterium SM2_3_26]|nr:acyl-CoA desaturase [Coleofasciculaceae cyanobacterium SM2_3_26]
MTIATFQKRRPYVPAMVLLGVIHTGALLAFLPGTFSWSAVGVAALLHWITGGLGITLGMHRLVTHRSFETPKWMEYFFMFCATLACQGGIIHWVGLHRLHHLHSDEAGDPHDSKEGFWWSHLGWMMFKGPSEKEILRHTKDICDDPFYRFCQNYFIPIQVVFAGLLFLLGGVPFVVWGIFVRLVVVFHCTWFVNSATHKFGYRTYDCKDTSTNCWWVALLTYGEGWHNNHHAFQYSARHGLTWWEIDLTWMTVQFLQWVGLATKVKLAPVTSQPKQ